MHVKSDEATKASSMSRSY